MEALGRFNYLRRKLRRKIGTATISRAADRHVAHAAAIEQILEMVRHETMAGRAFDPASIATLSDQLSIALMRANNAIRKAKAMKVTSKENRRARHRHIRQSG
jgi:hypothetical protein